jgi:type VI secretion system protein ImpK
MSSTVENRTAATTRTSSGHRAATDLVSLAAPSFDLILRIKAGFVTPSTELRPQVAAMLQKFEERATRFGYHEKVMRLAKFALAAFVDETVLTNNFPLREEWEKYPLQLEYFGEHLAGNKFFDRLEAMFKQAEAAADAIEVYYVCLLLGFKGKYGVYGQEELGNVIRRTAEILQRVGRLKQIDLSPHAFVQDQPEPPKKYPFLPAWAKIFALAGVVLSIIIYFILLLLAHNSMLDTLQKLEF